MTTFINDTDPFAGWAVDRVPVEQEEPPPLGQTEHDLDNLDPERAAHMIGARSAGEIEDLAPKKDRPYVRSVLTDPGAMRAALARQAIDKRTGTPVFSGPERISVILEYAAARRQAFEANQRYQAQVDADRTCAVTGLADPTTRPRILPWTPAGNPLTARLSNAGERAVLAAWFAAAPESDVALAERWMVTEGVLPKGSGKQ